MMESYEEEAPVIMMYQKGLGSSKPCSKRVRSQEDWEVEGGRWKERGSVRGIGKGGICTWEGRGVRVPFPETRPPSTGKSGDIGVQIARFSKCMTGRSCCSVATGRCGSACAPGSEDLAD